MHQEVKHLSYSHKLHWHAKFLLMQTTLLQAMRMPQLHAPPASPLSLSPCSQWNLPRQPSRELCLELHLRQRSGPRQQWTTRAAGTRGPWWPGPLPALCNARYGNPGRSAVTPAPALNSAPVASAGPPTRPAGLLTRLTWRPEGGSWQPLQQPAAFPGPAGTAKGWRRFAPVSAGAARSPPVPVPAPGLRPHDIDPPRTQRGEREIGQLWRRELRYCKVWDMENFLCLLKCINSRKFWGLNLWSSTWHPGLAALK